MADQTNPADRVGWEAIWRSGKIPPRFQSFSAPNATVVEWADTLPADGFVLDLGCGVGRHCVYLGGRGFRMAGLDISPTGIKVSQDVCSQRQIAFEGRVSDLTIIPWPDATFDAALSTSTIHHNLRAGIVQSIAEVRRVLKPGGLFLADFPCDDTDDFRGWREMVSKGQLIEPELNTFIDERPQSAGDDGHLPHHYSDDADVRDLLRSFEILKLWTDVSSRTPEGAVSKAKWVAWARKP